MNETNEFNQNYQPEPFARPEITEGEVATYVAKVMGWMFVGLLTTFVSTMLCFAFPQILAMVLFNPIGYYAVFVVQLIVVIAMSAMVNKISPAVATVMFMLYAALMGVTMSVLVLLFELQSILFVFLLTSFIFLTMALLGFVTKKDMTKMGRLCMFALFGIIISGIFNMFMQSVMLDYIISCVAVVVFIALIAYDTQKVKNFYINAIYSGESAEGALVRKVAIFGALSLYLDFINLFIRLLSILGRRK